MTKEIAACRRVTPFTRWAVLLPVALASDEAVSRRISDCAKENGVETVVVGTNDGALRPELVPADVAAVYLGPGLALEPSAIEAFAENMAARKIAVFSSAGKAEVEHGALASAAPEDYRQRLARRTALQVRRILSGESRKRCR